MAHRASWAHLAQYAALRGAFSLLHSFPVDANFRTARAVGRFYLSWSAKHRQRGLAHLEAAFEGVSGLDLPEINRRSFEHLMQLFMVEAMQAPRLLQPETWHRHVWINPTCENTRRAVALLRDGRPAIFLTGHCGNWELLGFMLSLLGFPMTALARPLDNPVLNRWIMGVREARGLKILTKFGASEEAIRVLRDGGRLGFIADQDAGVDGIFVPYFGRFASAYKSIALLAMSQEVPVIVGGAFRSRSGLRYQLVVQDIISPQEWVDAEDPLYLITARYTRGIEDMVRRYPEQYLWIHRRWKSRPRHEREGTPAPDRLARKVRSLPWLSQAEADGLLGRSSALAPLFGAGQ